MSHVAHQKFPVCPNCQYIFKDAEADNYCPSCGQENHDFQLPAKHLFYEVLENTLHFDSKFFKTLGFLLFKPGKLTQEFVLNRRMAYVPPFRLYVFISFFFFLILSLSAGHSGDVGNQGERFTSIEDLKPGEKRVRNLFFGLLHYTFEVPAPAVATDSAALNAQTKAPRKTGKFNRFMRERGLKWLSKTDAEIDQKILKTLSFLMFFLMPLFALFLKGMYLRQKRLYIEHLIFSIHFHCFAFIVIALFAVLANFISLKVLNYTIVLLLFVYLFGALRRFYRQGLGKTLAKTLLLQVVYPVTLFAFLFLALFINYLMV